MSFATRSVYALALTLGLAGTAGASLTIIDFNNTVGAFADIIPALPYLEDGFRLRNGTTSGANGLFDQNWAGLGRGSDYFGWFADTWFVIEEAAGAPFSLSSMDLGYLEDTTTALNYSILGHFSGGGTVTTSGSAVNLSTVSFNSAWKNLSSVDVTAIGIGGAVDNIVVNVPEPATLALLSLGLAGLGFSRRKKA
jgi:hypothetical protein